MDSKAQLRLDAISAAGWRLLFASILVALLVQVLATTRLFATALALAVAVALLLLDVARIIRRAQAGGGVSAGSEFSDQAKHLDRALALLDAVTVALFSLSADGRIGFSNRAGRQLSGADVKRLDDIPNLKGGAACSILALPPGGRQLVSMEDGRSALVWIGSFTTPDAGPQRLVSLQIVAGELDAVQVAAWHSMTRVLAHEMMNSLTPIASLSESLMRLMGPGGGTPEIAAAVDTIARQSRHLMSFVERYRTIVNLPEPRRDRLDLATFLADISALAGAQLREAGIAFSTSSSSAGETMHADGALLGQAVLNLIHNAADAVAAIDGGEVHLSCTRDGNSLEFQVSDNGIGVSSDHLEEIFVPFFTSKSGGAGIGLTLARQIALAHHGQLTATRNAGQGMTFRLKIAA